MPVRLFIGLVIVSFTLPACTERERNNIFDPGSGIEKLEIGLRAVALENIVRLSWYSPGDIEYNSIRIYRRDPGSSQFLPLKTLPAQSFGYQDTVSVNDVTYTYYLTLKGDDYESPPTPFVGATPGPGQIWILDRWAFEAVQLSYDLQSRKTVKYGIWIPENMCIDLNNNWGLITYPSYGIFEIFDLDRAYERLYAISDLRHPFDCIFDPAQRMFWVTDSSGALYKINPFSGNLTRVPAHFSQPAQIEFLDHSAIYVLDRTEKHIRIFNTAGENRGLLGETGGFILNNPEQMAVDQANRIVYIVDHLETSDILYKYTPDNGSAAILAQEENIKALAVNENEQTIWIASRNDLNSTVVQLSAAGFRLTVLDKFDNPIDLNVNPHNNNLLVIDAATSTVWHIRPDQSVVGLYDGSLQPYKVLVE